jgi:hypothetical protein
MHHQQVFQQQRAVSNYIFYFRIHKHSKDLIERKIHMTTEVASLKIIN